MEDSKTLFCSSQNFRGKRKNFFEIYSKFGHVPWTKPNLSEPNQI